MNKEEIYLELNDNEWPFTYIDHDRQIARAIVYDNNGFFYFVRVNRNDDFGKGIYIETSGGGVEKDETPEEAIIRELKEELGAKVKIVSKIGVISDYYNLIHRHNINNYYLCKIESFTNKNLTKEEKEEWKLSTLRLTYDEAIKEYELSTKYKLGRLIYNRELPILIQAKKIMQKD